MGRVGTVKVTCQTIVAALSRLHRWHSYCTFLSLFDPPLDTGIMWSYSSLSWESHFTHFP
jgi:hypothetical protein